MDISNVAYTNVQIKKVTDAVEGYFESTTMNDYGSITDVPDITVDWGMIV